MPKDSQNICDELKSTMVCHETSENVQNLDLLHKNAFIQISVAYEH